MTEPRPRQIKTHCVLGAVFAPEGGSVSGLHARDYVQRDPSNLLSATFYHQSLAAFSQRLRSVPQSAGGITPQVNTALGAPMATFAFGAIDPDQPHGLLPLIKGPTTSPTDPSVTYYFDPSSESPSSLGDSIGDGAFAPTYTPPEEEFGMPQYPYIPSTGNGVAATTYNVWRQVAAQSTEQQYRISQYFGVNIYEELGLPLVTQHVTKDNEAYLTVYAQETDVVLERMFPIADDLAYGDVSLQYPPVLIGGQVLQNPARKIKASGGEYCGFHLRFRLSQIARVTNPNSKKSTGGLRIRWGAVDNNEDPSKRHIRKFQLVCVPGQTPMLYYQNPLARTVTSEENVSTSFVEDGRLWVKFADLDGPVFNGGIDFDVYVHFSGPHMLIGFDPDVNRWNCFAPKEGGTSDFDAYWEPRIPANSRVSVQFSNLTSTLQYGPIAFNNFHPENLVNSIATDADLGKINCQFVVPVSKKGEATETAINTEFQKHRVPLMLEQTTDGMKNQPTFLGDWRRSDPEMYFKLLAEQQLGSDWVVKGQVVMDTTIEGPQFLHIRNYMPQNTVDPAKLIQDLQWGDVSSYITDWSVEIQLEGINSSLLKAKAVITLEGLANDPNGADILTMLEENILAVTLGAGFGESKTYFQGVVDTVRTTYKLNAPSVTILECTDIMWALMSDIPFSAVLRFAGMRYWRIIQDCMHMAGLGDFYRVRARLNAADPFWNALDFRLGEAVIPDCLAAEAVTTNTSKVIMQTLRPILELVNNNGALPVFWWDPEIGRLRLDNRFEQPVDELFFIGAPTPENQTFLPNNYAEREHGVVQDGWSTLTDLRSLHAALTIFGTKGNGLPMAYRRRFSEALSQSGLNSLKNAVGTSSGLSLSQIGWVGYNKGAVIKRKQNELTTDNALNFYGAYMTNIVRQTYQSLDFTCLVTEPLSHYSRFKILSFVGGERTEATNTYFYKSVRYDFSRHNSQVTATVTGEQYPRHIE